MINKKNNGSVKKSIHTEEIAKNLFVLKSGYVIVKIGLDTLALFNPLTYTKIREIKNWLYEPVEDLGLWNLILY